MRALRSVCLVTTLCLLFHLCYSAVLVSIDVQDLEEDRFGYEIKRIEIGEKKQSTGTFSRKISDSSSSSDSSDSSDSSSSTEEKTHVKTKCKDSSGSSDCSSSSSDNDSSSSTKEVKQRKRGKRSINSNQEAQNEIINTSSNTNPKEHQTEETSEPIAHEEARTTGAGEHNDVYPTAVQDTEDDRLQIKIKNSEHSIESNSKFNLATKTSDSFGLSHLSSSEEERELEKANLTNPVASEEDFENSFSQEKEQQLSLGLGSSENNSDGSLNSEETKKSPVKRSLRSDRSSSSSSSSDSSSSSEEAKKKNRTKRYLESDSSSDSSSSEERKKNNLVKRSLGFDSSSSSDDSSSSGEGKKNHIVRRLLEFHSSSSSDDSSSSGEGNKLNLVKRSLGLDSSSSIDDSSSSGEGKKIHLVKRSLRSDSSSSSSSSSDNSSSSEKAKKSNRTKRFLESDSSKDSSSSEERKKKHIVKRSLEINEEPHNAISKGSIEQHPKENQASENKETTVVELIRPTESTINEESVTMSVPDNLSKETTEPTIATDSTVADFIMSTIESTETTQLPFGETEHQTEFTETTENNYDTTTDQQGTTVVMTTEPATTEDLETKADDQQTTTASTLPEATETHASGTSDADSEEEDSEVHSKNSTSPESSSTPPTSDEKQQTTLLQVAMARVNKLSDQIRLVLQTYRLTNAVVIPGQTFFPDPMPMQDFDRSFSVGTMTFRNMYCHGLSNFTIEHVNTDVDRMQVYVLLHMKRLVILGNYTMRAFWTKASGPFNVTLLEVDSEGVAEVATAPEGHLEATDSQMDMSTKEMKLDFKNMGMTGSFLQGAVGAVGDALFNSIKPQILERVNVIIRTDVNKKLKEFSTKFINKVAPVDLAFSEGRKYVKNNGYDPYHINDHSFLIGGLVHVNITEFTVEGLSKFYRVGNLSLSMDQGNIEIGVHVLTEKLTGSCVWSGQTFGIIKSGKTNFTVDHLQARALVTQSLDVRKKPQLRDLDLELGWVKVTMDSPMTLNLMIEGIINAFPRLIRHIIVDTLEEPLKEKIQEILDKINVESVVDEHLPRLDSFGL